METYPSLDRVISRIHDANLLMRANVVLSKNNLGTYEKFVSLVESLRGKGVDCISAWPIRNADDVVDPEMSPLERELDRMEGWVERNQDEKCRLRLLRGKSRAPYAMNQKLTLFPNGVLSNNWCKN